MPFYVDWCVLMVLSYVVGQRYLRVPYDLRAIGGYFALSCVLLGIYALVVHYWRDVLWACYLCRVVLIVIYACVVYWREWPKLRRTRL